jgi:hypothetical protein
MMSSSTLAASTLLPQIGQQRINGSGRTKRGIHPSMFLPFLLFALFTFSLNSASPTVAEDDRLEGFGQQTDIVSQNNIDYRLNPSQKDIEAKSCTATYECWPTEPVLDDGRPLMMMTQIGQ